MLLLLLLLLFRRVLHRKYLKTIAALHYERWGGGGGGDNTQKLHNVSLYKHCVHAWLACGCRGVFFSFTPPGDFFSWDVRVAFPSGIPLPACCISRPLVIVLMYALFKELSVCHAGQLGFPLLFVPFSAAVEYLKRTCCE